MFSEMLIHLRCDPRNYREKRTRIQQQMDSKSRAEFLEECKAGGKYAGTVGIYRHNESSKHIGVFDAELIKALPDSVGWIAHNGAGYDQIDVNACKEKGTSRSFVFP